MDRMSRKTGQPPGAPRTPTTVVALRGGKPRSAGPVYPPSSGEPPEHLQLSPAAVEFWHRKCRDAEAENGRLRAALRRIAEIPELRDDAWQGMYDAGHIASAALAAVRDGDAT